MSRQITTENTVAELGNFNSTYIGNWEIEEIQISTRGWVILGDLQNVKKSLEDIFTEHGIKQFRVTCQF